MVEQMVLRDISIHVKDMGIDITNYGLPELDASGKLINIKILENFFLFINIVFTLTSHTIINIIKKINASYSSILQ